MNKKTLGTVVSLLTVVLLIIYIAFQYNNQLQTANTQKTVLDEHNKWRDNKVIVVDPCNMSGKRQANVKVDIGYGERAYFAFTNEYEQLVRVQAEEVTLQKDDEHLTEKGRYCTDEARVPGTQRAELDQGHVIADSLGGVSNAYNITPQATELNHRGAQAKMEEEIRQSLFSRKKVTDFIAEIEYPNTKSQTPAKYQIQFKINGKEKSYSFENK